MSDLLYYYVCDNCGSIADISAEPHAEYAYAVSKLGEGGLMLSLPFRLTSKLDLDLRKRALQLPPLKFLLFDQRGTSKPPDKPLRC